MIGSPYDDTFIVGNSTSTFEAGAGYDSIVLPGPAADYEIILNRQVLTARHIASNRLYRFPDGERLTFNDKSYGLEDFPGDGDAVAVMTQGSVANAVILKNPTNEVIVLESNPSKGNVNLNLDGTHSYISNASYIGDDSFAVRITDPSTGLIRIQNMDISVNVNGQTIQNVIDTTQSIREPRDIIRLSDGSYMLAFIDTIWTPDPNNGLNGQWEYRVLAQNYDSNFKKIGSDKIMATAIRTIINSVIAGDSLAWAKLDQLQNGNIALVWQYDSGSTGKAGIYHVRLDPQGNQITPNQLLSKAGASAFYPAVKALSNGDFMVGFSQAEPGITLSIVAQRYDANSNKISERPMDTDANHDRCSIIDEFSNGDVLISWATDSSSQKEVVAKILYADGGESEIFGSLISQWGLRDTSEDYFDTKVLAGNTVVFCYTTDTYDTVIQTFDSNGGIINEFMLLTQAVDGPTPDRVRLLKVDENQFIALWSKEQEQGGQRLAQYQLFDNQLTPLSERRQINEVNGYGVYPEAIHLSDGNIQFIYNDISVGMVASKIINVFSTLTGSIGNDVLEGDIQQNIILSSEGADTLDGGNNTDTVSYENSPEAVIVDLNVAPLLDEEGRSYIPGIGGHAENDRLRSIENLIGSSFDDVLVGELGDNYINGSTGFDFTRYQGNTSDYNVLIDGEEVSVTDLNSNGGIDTFVEVEQFNFADRNFSINEFPLGFDSRIRVNPNATAVGILGSTSQFIFTIDTLPQQGNLTFHGNGTFTYFPRIGYLGSDAFSYIKQNNANLSRRLSVSVEVAGDNPIKATIVTEFQVNERTDGSNTRPALAMVNNSLIFYTWGKSNSNNYNGVFSRVFNLAGTALTHDCKVDYLDTTGAHDSDVMGLPDGNAMVFWDEGDGIYSPEGNADIIGQKVDTKGRVFSEYFQVNRVGIGATRYPKSSLLSNGKIVSVYHDEEAVYNYHLRAQVFTPNGTLVGNEIYIDSRNMLGTYFEVLALENRFVVVYEKEGSGVDAYYDIFKRSYSNDGIALSNSELVNTVVYGDQRNPTVFPTPGDGYGIAWFDFHTFYTGGNSGNGIDTTIVLQRFSNLDAAIGGEVNIARVNNAVDVTWSISARQNIQVTNLGKGFYFASWAAANDIRGKILDKNFTAVGEELPLFDGRGGSIDIHAATYLSEGKLALAWTAYDPNNSDDNIRTQIIDVSFPVISGTKGNDVLQAGSGDDVIAGKEGANVYQTGAGKDTVVISVNPDVQEIITDFDLVNDVLDLSAYNFLINGFSDLKRHLIQEGADTVIDFGNGHRIVLQNITMANLMPAHFIGTSGANSLPVARLWQATTVPGMNVTIDVLSQASDLDGETLIISSLTQPANGTVTIVNGTIHYIPSAGFQGIEQLSYVVSDGHGGETVKQLSIVVEPEVVVPPQMNITIQPLSSNVASPTSSNPGSLFNSNQPSTPSVNPTPVPSVNPIPVSSVNPTPASSINTIPASSVNTIPAPSVNTIPASSVNAIPVSSVNPILGASAIPMPLPEASELNPASPPAPPFPSSANRLSNPFSSLFALPAAILGSTEKIDNPSSTAEDNIPIDETLPDYNSSVSEQLMLFRLVGHYMKGWMPWNKARELTSLEADTLRGHKAKLGLLYEKLTNFKDGTIESCGLFDEKLSWLDKSIREAHNKIHSVLKKTETTSSQWDELTNKVIKIEKMLDGLTSKQQQLETLEVESTKLAEQGKRYAICYDSIKDMLKIKVELIKEETNTCPNPWEIPTKTPFGQQQQFWSNARVHASVPEQLAVQPEEVRRLKK